MGSRSGGGYAAPPSSLALLRGNIAKLRERYPTTPGGYFGVRGKGKYVRLIQARDPYAAAQDFWSRITRGGIVDTTPNGHPRIRFEDGSQITYRVATTTAGSPGITLTIESTGLGIARFQRLHFRKESE